METVWIALIGGVVAIATLAMPAAHRPPVKQAAGQGGVQPSRSQTRIDSGGASLRRAQSSCPDVVPQ